MGCGAAGRPVTSPEMAAILDFTQNRRKRAILTTLTRAFKVK